MQILCNARLRTFLQCEERTISQKAECVDDQTLSVSLLEYILAQISHFKPCHELSWIRTWLESVCFLKVSKSHMSHFTFQEIIFDFLVDIHISCDYSWWAKSSYFLKRMQWQSVKHWWSIDNLFLSENLDCITVKKWCFLQWLLWYWVLGCCHW